MAKSIYEGGNNEEVLKANKELYELRVAKHGEGSKLAINSGKNTLLIYRKPIAGMKHWN